MRLLCWLNGCATDEHNPWDCCRCGAHVDSADWLPVPIWAWWKIKRELLFKWKYRQILHRCECGKFIWFRHCNSKCSRECFDKFLPF